VFAAVAAPESWTDEGCYIAELSNSPHDAQVSIARARVPAGRTTRWHRLEGIVERYVILEGRGRVEVEGLGSPRDVGPGDVVLIPASAPQRIASIGGDDLVFLAVCTPRFDKAAYVDVDALTSRR
jgi:mannose-6-phosphate isomerase-like protein (cupin superfamily)